MALPVSTHSTEELPFSDFADILSVTDLLSLRGRSPSQVRDWAAAQADKHQRIGLAHRSLYNAVAPIHTLPPEILSMILAHCWKNRRSLRVAHVCRRWRAAALKTPEFWAHAAAGEVFGLDHEFLGGVRFDREMDYLSTVIARAAPRRIQLHLRHFGVILSNFARAHEGRIASLHVALFSEDELELLHLALQGGFLSLQELNISFDEEDVWFDDQPDFQERYAFPPDRFLYLTTLTVPGSIFAPLAQRSLQHVTLVYPRLPSIVHLVDALKKCPSLRSFSSTSALPELGGSAAETPVVDTPLELPMLEVITVTEAGQCAAKLFRLFRLPAIRRFHLQDAQGLGVSRIISPESNEVLRRIVHAIDRVHVQGSSGANVLVSAYSSVDECLRLDHFGLTSICLRDEDYVALFRDCPHLVQLSVSTPTALSSCATTFFRGFPHLTSLQIVYHSAASLFRALYAPDNAEDRRSLVCPSLRKLDVSFPFRAMGDVKTALKNRQKSGTLAALLRTHSMLIAEVLSRRASLGSRLTDLKWSMFDAIPPTMLLEQGSVQLTLEDLEDDGHFDIGIASVQRWVDGPASFGTFTVMP